MVPTQLPPRGPIWTSASNAENSRDPRYTLHNSNSPINTNPAAGSAVGRFPINPGANAAAIMRAYTGSFRGAGKTLTAAAISVLMLGGIRIPIAGIAAGPLGETGVRLAFAISTVAGATIAYAWYRCGSFSDAATTEIEVDLDDTSAEVSADGD